MKTKRAQEYELSKPLLCSLVTVGLWAVKVRIKAVECCLCPRTKRALSNIPVS